MSAWVVTMGAGATMGSCIRRWPFHPKEWLGPKSITWAAEMAKHNSGDRQHNSGTLATPPSVQYQCQPVVECMNLLWIDLASGAIGVAMSTYEGAAVWSMAGA